MPLAAQCRKVCDIYRPPGTRAPQKSEKMRYLTKSHVLWALGEIFSGAMTPFWHSLLGEDIVYSRDTKSHRLAVHNVAGRGRGVMACQKIFQNSPLSHAKIWGRTLIWKKMPCGQSEPLQILKVSRENVHLFSRKKTPKIYTKCHFFGVRGISHNEKIL